MEIFLPRLESRGPIKATAWAASTTLAATAFSGSGGIRSRRARLSALWRSASRMPADSSDVVALLQVALSAQQLDVGVGIATALGDRNDVVEL